MVSGQRPQIPLIDLARQTARLRPQLLAAVERVLASSQFILGPEVEAFEREVAAYVGVPHAVAVASGTDALELTLRALEVGPGDEVITTPFTFLATAEAIALCGATPIFADIDPATYTLDPRQVERRITRKTRAIIPVHLFGHPCAMEDLQVLASRHGLALIEDAAQAMGAAVGTQRVGSCGTAGCFSFYPSKNLGAFGDGGLVTTRDETLAERLRLLRNHGSAAWMRQILLGRNSRLDELQAALLRVKFVHLEDWNTARRRHASTYTRLIQEQCSGTGVVTPQEQSGVRHVYHLYVIRVPQRDAIRQALEAEGIATGVYYPMPLHLQATLLGGDGGVACPQAEVAAESVLALPLFPELTEPEIATVVDALGRSLRRLHAAPSVSRS